MAPKHSNLGPSSAERWMACPGSVGAALLAPARAKAWAAAEGTVAHELCEKFVSEEVSSHQLQDRLGEIVEQEGFLIPITQEMIDAAFHYAGVIWLDEDGLREKYPGLAVTGEVEKQVAVSSISPELFGTADFVSYIAKKVLRVYDYKFGKKSVNPEENKQLAIYAMGILDALDISPDEWDEIELVIIQPRAGGKKVRRWKIPAGWLANFHKELAQAVAETAKPDAPLRVGAWCWWCPANQTCPAKDNERIREAAEDFA